MRTRDATNADVPFLAEMLVHAAFPPWLDPMPTPAEALADTVAGRHLRGWGRPGDAGVIAEVDGRPIGAAWYRLFTSSEPGHGFVAEDVPEIAVAVAPGARAAGVGTAMVGALIELARKQGVHALSLSVSIHNPAALRLYQGAGFVPVGGTDDHPTMLLTIPPISDLVEWVTRQIVSADKGSQRLATVVDREERVVVMFETGRWGRVVAKAGRDPMAFDREVAALDAASSAGARVPRVHLRLPGDRTLLVVAHVDGIALGPESTSVAWSAAGAALREIHSSQTRGIATFGDGRQWPDYLADWIEREVASAEATSALDALEAEQAGSYLKRGLVGSRADTLIHGDCAPDHFLMTGDHVAGIVDFGDAGLADPVYDLAVLTLWQPDRLAVVLDGYGADADFRAGLARLREPFVLLRLLAAARWLRERDYDASRHENAARALLAGPPASLTAGVSSPPP